jgi:hypothetical protein
MELSDRTREQIEEHLRQANIRANAARGHAEADRKVIVEEVVGEAAIQRVSKAILRALRRADGEWVTHSKLRKSLNSRDRDWFEAAIGHLIGAGQVEVKAGDRPGQLPGGPGSSYRIAT